MVGASIAELREWMDVICEYIVHDLEATLLPFTMVHSLCIMYNLILLKYAEYPWSHDWPMERSVPGVSFMNMRAIFDSRGRNDISSCHDCVAFMVV